jgi:hypothetical protein
MFEDLRQAWKDAVENFWRELQEDDGTPGGHGDESHKQLAAMRREVHNADGELKRLGAEVERTRVAATAEENEERVCRRRLAMAEGIGDAETARVAATYADRAAERAAVLARKAEALEAERDLRQRELAEMKEAVDAAAAALGAGTAPGGTMGPGEGAGAGAGGGAARDPGSVGGLGTDWGLADEEGLAREREYRRMREEAREKAANARLEELKKRMQ